MPRHPCVKWFCLACCCCCGCEDEEDYWKKMAPPDQEEMEEKEQIAKDNFCCLEYFPKTNKFCRASICCWCRCCCASWAHITFTKLAVMRANMKKTVANFDALVEKAELREGKAQKTQRSHERELQKMKEEKAPEYVIKDQIKNTLIGARNLRQTQRRCWKLRRSLEFFEVAQDKLDGAFAAKDFIEGWNIRTSIHILQVCSSHVYLSLCLCRSLAATPFGKLMKKYHIGENVMSEEKAGEIIGDLMDALDNMGLSVDNVDKAIGKKVEQAQEKADKESSNGEIIDVSAYARWIQTEFGVSADLMSSASASIKANKERAVPAPPRKEKESKALVEEVELSKTVVAAPAPQPEELNGDAEFAEFERAEAEAEAEAEEEEEEDEKKEGVSNGEHKAISDAIAVAVEST